ncbi:hypothetical protein F4860DRAFT_25033 [Xylaria cubensis]|nr:hypothetical protein F4860DRAFT_25033 [Xylaria cubensis]
MSSYNRVTRTNPAAPSFPQFLNLPLELREMIWKFALPGHRNYLMPHDIDDIFDNCSKFYAPLSQVCSESRRVVLEAGYRLVDTSDRNAPKIGVWFCKKRGDMVMVPNGNRLVPLRETYDNEWYWRYNAETHRHTFHLVCEFITERKQSPK